jgi:GR25 family glycosyltransferase involved in LPS biosynthesis
MRNNTNKNKHRYPPPTINNYVSHVIYINIDARKDRKDRILNELSIFDPQKITRVSAVKNLDNPIIGCTQSHIKALKLAKKMQYPNVLILEDDAVWANIKEGYHVFEHLVKKPYDVIMLGGTMPKFNRDTFAVTFSYGAHAYLVNSSYYDTIIHEAESAVNLYDPSRPGSKKENAAINVKYTKLQPKHKWFIISPPLMFQGKSYSNIEKTDVNHSPYQIY